MSDNEVIYNLNKLLQPFDFAILPEDDIKEIKIGMMRLSPYNGECDIIVKVPATSNRTIYEIVGQWINTNSPIIDNFVVKEVGLDVKLNDDERASVTVKSYYDQSANSSILDDMIHRKYLKYWGLVI